MTSRIIALHVMFLVICTFSCYPFGKVYDSRVDLYDVQHYDISMSFNFPERSFSGNVVVAAKSLKPVSTFVLYASEQTMTIDSVLYGERKMEFTNKSDKLSIPVSVPIARDADFSFRIFYHGISSYHGQYDAGGILIDIIKGLGCALTSSEPIYAHNWWPCKDVPDDKATVSVTLTVPANLIGISNGALKKIERNTGTATYFWETKYQIAPYLVSVNVGDYKQINDTYTGLNGQRMKIVYYVFPQDFNNAKADFENTPKILNFFAEKFGEYPFIDEKFGFVEVPTNLTMENQTICAIEDRLITGKKLYENTFVHEIAHHWWGDLITPQNWLDSWLNEGFATYSEALYREHTKGTAGYRQYINQLMDVKPGHYAGSVIGRNDTSYWDCFSTRVYNKGGIILHMLRGVMGDDKFFLAMRNYSANPRLRYANATSKDFIDECEAVYGSSLKWFFDEWLYANTPTIDRPEYEYSWKESASAGSSGLKLSIEQKTSATLLYKMPMTVTIFYGQKSMDYSIVDSLAVQNFTLPVSIKPDNLEIDSNRWVFKTMIHKNRQ